jgi:Polyketide cyclase / dehydrase and lipid transport
MKVRYSVTVHKPVDEVFRFVATDFFDNRPKWSTQDAPLVKGSDGPTRVGSEGRAIAKDRNGQLFERRLVVTEYIPTSRFSTESNIAYLVQEGTTVRRYPSTKSTATMTFEPEGAGTNVHLSAEGWFHNLSTYGKLRLSFVYGYYRRRFQNGSIRNMDRIATLLDGPSTVREMKSFAVRAWSWWYLYALVFLALVVLYSDHQALQLTGACTQVLQTVLIVMGVVGFMALYIFLMMQKSTAKW